LKTFLGLGCLCLASSVMADVGDLPPGFRYPNRSDYQGQWQEYAQAGTPIPCHVRADFDGNGVEDDAWILIGTKPTDGKVVVFMRGKLGKPTVVDLEQNGSSDEPVWKMGLFPIKRGKHTIVCATNYPPCTPGRKVDFIFKNPGLRTETLEINAAVYIWDQKKGSFLVLANEGE